MIAQGHPHVEALTGAAAPPSRAIVLQCREAAERDSHQNNSHAVQMSSKEDTSPLSELARKNSRCLSSMFGQDCCRRQDCSLRPEAGVLQPSPIPQASLRYDLALHRLHSRLERQRHHGKLETLQASQDAHATTDRKALARCDNTYDFKEGNVAKVSVMPCAGATDDQMTA